MFKFSSVSFSIKDKKIINNINFHVNKGDFIVVLGHNGAGKSTLFDLISGKYRATSGKIVYHKQDITNDNDIMRSAFISRLYQNPRHNIVSSMTVEENLSLSLYKGRMATLRSGVSGFSEEFFAPLKELFSDLKRILHTKMQNLSGGQQQAIASFMVTAYTPKILLLDEPTAALDPNSATRVLQFLNKTIQQKGITTFLITHDPMLAMYLGNKVWILEDGQLKEEIDKAKVEIVHPEQLIGSIAYKTL